MKKYILFYIIFLLGLKVFSQNFEITRSDVDSTQSGFVSVGAMFGLDIQASGIYNCNRLIFEFSYTNADVVKYSGYTVPYFGKYSNSLVYEQFDSTNKTDTILVTIAANTNSDSLGFDFPKLIHFDFIALRSAVSGTNFDMSINNPKVYILQNGGDSLLVPTVNKLTMTIHGFVNVWPGDANNDGIVDNADARKIIEVIGNSDKKHFKKFQRETASTIWMAQPVLEWDDVPSTYADCDGNGEVNFNDILVVIYNSDSTHLLGIKKGEKSRNYSGEPEVLSEPVIPNDFKILPLEIELNSPGDITALNGEIQFNGFDDSFDIYSADLSNVFGNETQNYSIYDKENKILKFVSGNRNIILPKNNNKHLSINLAVNSNFNLSNLNNIVSNIRTLNFSGIDTKGNILPINASFSTISGLNENIPQNIYNECNITVNDENIAINGNNNIIRSVELFDAEGNILIRKDVGEFSVNISLTGIESGVYFVRIETEKGSEIKPILLIK